MYYFLFYVKKCMIFWPCVSVSKSEVPNKFYPKKKILNNKIFFFFFFPLRERKRLLKLWISQCHNPKSLPPKRKEKSRRSQEVCTFDSAITIDVEARWENISRMMVVMVGPSSYGVTANVSIWNPRRLSAPSHFSLLIVQGQPRLHWVCSVNVVPKLRW